MPDTGAVYERVAALELWLESLRVIIDSIDKATITHYLDLEARVFEMERRLQAVEERESASHAYAYRFGRKE